MCVCVCVCVYECVCVCVCVCTCMYILFSSSFFSLLGFSASLSASLNTMRSESSPVLPIHNVIIIIIIIIIICTVSRY